MAEQARKLESMAAKDRRVVAEDEHCAYVVACLASAVAFLEANINEFVSDLNEGMAADNSMGCLPVGRFKALMAADPAVDRKPTLDKYQWILAVADRPLFAKGANPYQDVSLVIDLRNALIHFRPTWQTSGAEEVRIARALRARFENPLLDPPWLFPYSLMCFRLAAWATLSAHRFAEEFADRLGNIPGIAPPTYLRPYLEALRT